MSSAKKLSAREAASLYISKGWYPIPLTGGTKECKDRDWLDRVYTPEEFQDNDNIGIRLVDADDEFRSVKLVGVDLDSPETVASAWSFLPPSKAAWGRESKTISQVLYKSSFKKAIVFKDYCGEKKPTLLEIRVKHQSMAPPSLHPSGEDLEWLNDEIDASEIEHDELLRACKMLATSAMIARYYAPPGARHEWTLALTGTLRRFGLTEDDVSLLFSASGNQAGDKKIPDRLTEVHSTFSKADDDPTTGANALAEQMPENGRKFVETLRRIWGSSSDFTVNERSGRAVQSNPDNIRSALVKMNIELCEDVFAQRLKIKINGVWDLLDDAVADRLWLEIHSKFGFLPGRDVFDTVIRDTARKTKIHPVREFLSSLTWDKKPRLDRWLVEYGGAKESQYSMTVGSMVMIAAVRRVRLPGCKFDELLVLESPQGQNKSTALRTLCPEEDWFTDDLPLGVDAKQIIERTSGKWIVEAAELLNMRRAHIEQLKASLSRQVDGPVRLAYGRFSTEVPRQFVIIGTTNSSTYLKDDTGNRRFWPVQVQRFDITRLKEDRDQLWAEAAVRESQAASIRLPEELWPIAGLQQERRRKEDPWEAILKTALSEFEGASQRVEPAEIWKILGIPIERMDEGSNERIHRIMSQLGFRKISVRRGSQVVKGWGRDLVDGVFRPAGWE